MKIILFANTEWYLFNFRMSLAKALQAQGHEVLLISPPGEYGARLQAMVARVNAVVRGLIRRVLFPHVPQALIERPKLGFGVPIDSWLRGLFQPCSHSAKVGRAFELAAQLAASVIVRVGVPSLAE